MSEIRANSITDAAGTGAPNFPNGLTDNGVAVATTADLSTINTALEFISSATINNVATVDFTGFDSSKYSDYVFSLNNVIPATDGTTLFMRMSADGGSTFLTSYVYNRFYATNSTTSVDGETDAFPGANILLSGGVGSDTNEFGISGEVRLFGPDLAARTNITSLLCSTSSAAATNIYVTSGQNRTTSEVNAVRFYFFSGNLESGRITMYGVRKS